MNNIITTKEKIFHFFKIHLIIFIPTFISITYTFFKILYIETISNYYKLPAYYFEHLNLNSFLKTVISITLILIALNLWKSYSPQNSKILYFIFYTIISGYSIYEFNFLITEKIFSFHNCLLIISIFTPTLLILKKFFSISLICSFVLLFLIIFNNFFSIKAKKEYEIGTLKNYQQVILITLNHSDYLVAEYTMEKDILYINTSKKRWINRLNFINIKSETFKQIEIIS